MAVFTNTEQWRNHTVTDYIHTSVYTRTVAAIYGKLLITELYNMHMEKL